MEPVAAPEPLGFGFRSLACRVRRNNIAAIKASPITVPVTMIPALAPVRRPVFGVDKGCGKTVIVNGEVLDEEFIKGLKEVDAGDSVVEARAGFVEEGTDKSDSTAADEETDNCSGEGASKVSLLGIEQSSIPAP